MGAKVLVLAKGIEIEAWLEREVRGSPCRGSQQVAEAEHSHRGHSLLLVATFEPEDAHGDKRVSNVACLANVLLGSAISWRWG